VNTSYWASCTCFFLHWSVNSSETNRQLLLEGTQTCLVVSVGGSLLAVRKENTDDIPGKGVPKQLEKKTYRTYVAARDFNSSLPLERVSKLNDEIILL
jgi:hypothetical protein